MRTVSGNIRFQSIIFITILLGFILMPNYVRGANKSYLYNSHSPIFISGNLNFTSANGVVAGLGTQSDPYIIEGWDINGTGVGSAIYIYGTTDYFIVRDNYLHDANGSRNGPSCPRNSGVILENVQNGTIEGNIVIGNGLASIYLCSSNGNSIANNSISRNGRSGVELQRSSTGNLIERNNISENHWYGIVSERTKNNDIIENNISENENGMLLIDSDGFHLNRNNMFNNRYAIELWSSNNFDILYNNISQNQNAIGLSGNENNVTGNIISRNWGSGLHIYSADNNKISYNKISDNYEGIFLVYSNGNTIVNNNVSKNSDGIYIREEASGNFILNNNFSNNYYGVYLESTTHNSFENNVMYNDGIVIDGYHLEHWDTHNIPPSNLVNGHPVYYYKDQSGINVPEDAGQVILANCYDFTMADLMIKNASAGIQLAYSSNITAINSNILGNADVGIYLYQSNKMKIVRNNISGSSVGIYSDTSSDGNVEQNRISGNYDGIYFYDKSNGNRISSNQVINNSRYGFYSVRGTGNQLTNNNISQNRLGLYLVVSDNNTIIGNDILHNSDQGIILNAKSNNNTVYYNDIVGNAKYGINCTYLTRDNFIHHNNFVNNNNGFKQAYDNVGNNKWNDVAEGNYWSDWTTPDNDSNGIVDFPYLLNGGKNAKDYFPLTIPAVVGFKGSEPLWTYLLSSIVIILFLILVIIAIKKRKGRK